MHLPQTALVPLPTPVEGLNTSSKNKITKGGVRQAQGLCASCYGDSINLELTSKKLTLTTK